MSVRRVKQLALNDTAAIAPLYAIGIFALVAIAGVGFDYSRMASLDSELQNAADQAALAGATQLDGVAANGSDLGACARAAAAVQAFVINDTRFADDGGSSVITFQNETTCDATGRIRFWQDRDGNTAATDDENANYIEVFVDPRSTRYVLTPLVEAFGTGQMGAAAMAGLGSAVCKQPPIMICHPDPGSDPKNNPNPFADTHIGAGVLATGHNTGNSDPGGGKNDGDAGGSGSNNTWSPGNFGFLQVEDPDSNAKNKALLKALAYDTPPIDCISVDENKVSTGNPQNFYNALNTRFGIYNFPSNGNSTLAPCFGGACTAAPNVRSDMAYSGNGNANQCKLGKGNGAKGWRLPDDGKEFKPVVPTSSPVTSSHIYSANNPVSKMGLPRDLCHYDTFNASGLCTAASGSGRIGDGVWARNDYWTFAHPGMALGSRPLNWKTMTRYQTYLWELDPNGDGDTSDSKAEGSSCGVPNPDPSRRVLTIAVVTNCSELHGSSREVDISEWADVFMVEPLSDDSVRHTPFKDSLYVEIIGKAKIAGSGVFGSQEVRRDVPYLVK